MYKNIAIIIFVFIFSCKDKQVVFDKPDGLIEKHELINILTDIHIIDATLITLNTKYNINDDSISKQYYNFLITKYNTDRNRLQKSIEFYSNYPKEMESIYDSVQVRLNTMEVNIAQP